MPAPAPTKPRILLLSLDGSRMFDDLYQRFLRKLNVAAAVDRVAEPEPTLRYLAAQTPDAVLVTDAGIADASDVRDALLAYVRAGGTVVFMGVFSSMINGDDFEMLFRAADLPWTQADYTRTTVYRNRTAETMSPAYNSLPDSYSQKAVFLKNVEKSDAWYFPTDASRVESNVFGPAPVSVQQTPVAIGRVGKGRVGYVGDVNGEEESDAVVLTMCGL